MESSTVLEVPFNREAEEAVLLSCFLSEESLYTALEEVADSDFYVTGFSTAFEAIRRLSNDNSSIDKTTVSNQIRDEESKENFLSIFDRGDVNPANVIDYCNIVKEHTKLRSALEVSYLIQQKVRSNERNADTIIEEAETMLFKAIQREESQQFVTPADLFDESYATMTAKAGNKKTLIGLSTTIPKLDEITYGLERGTLTIVAGRPSMGKTELSLQMAVANASKGYPVAVFSIEQPHSELMERIICNYTEIGLSKIKQGFLNKDDVKRLEAQSMAIKDLPLLIDDTPNISITHIVAKSKRLKKKTPNLSMIVIDYLQLMQSHNKGNSRNEELTHISRSLKVLARILDIPIIAISQLSRDCEKRENKRPLLSDLRESGAIEQDADKVIFMYSDYPYLNKKEVTDIDKYKGEIIVAKHRNGPVDTVLITNNKPIQKIYDREVFKPEQVGYSQAIETIEPVASVVDEDDDLPF